MNIKTFAKTVGCGKLANYDSLLGGSEGRYIVIAKAVKELCVLLGAGKSAKDAMASVRMYLCSEYDKLGFHYHWQAETYAADDTMKFERFLQWLSQYRVEKACEAGEMAFHGSEMVFPDGSNTLSMTLPLVCRDADGRYHGLIIHPGKSKKSLKGRSNATNARFDLEPLVAKTSYESRYPGIIIDCVYLTHDKDEVGNTQTVFDVSSTGSTNCHEIEYPELYGKDGSFNWQLARDMVAEAMSYVSAKCDMCEYASMCKSEGSAVIASAFTEEEAAASSYRMPTYTEEQKKAISHVDGPLRILAGPGSGKTATLVGRIKYLVEEQGVDPMSILVVVFANEAAEEIRDRCRSFLPEYALPTIATLNSFAYQCIRDNLELLGLSELKVLTDKEQCCIIKNLLECMVKPLQGFKYDMEKGKMGLFQTIKRALTDYSTMEMDVFFNKYPKLGDDFVAFADDYKGIIEYGNYITFDEQITLCNKLFADNPDILAQYVAVYQYIMVDEFQDLNAEQMDMVVSLASHQNIVVVGDDDQNLYKFRGADVKFLLEFEQYFPGAKTVVLKDNFRSTKSIVESSNGLIKNNGARINKDIRSGNSETGELPFVVRDTSNDAVLRTLHEVLAAGYSPDDVAVIAFTNGTLESIYDDMDVPCYLAKSYLRNDGFFNFVRSVMRLHRSELCDDMAFLTFMGLFNKTHLVKKVQGLSLYEATKDSLGLGDVRTEDMVSDVTELSFEWEILHSLYQLLQRGTEVGTFIKFSEIYLDWKKSNAADVILEQLEKADITEMKDFADYLDQVSEFEDATRVEVNSTGKVALITSHDSKGKEWPVVLFVNDMKDASETGRRLFYVSVTRAKKKVVVFEEKNSKAPFSKELKHTECAV